MQDVSIIERIGRDIAGQVAGPDAIDEVKVTTGLSWTDEPTYEFYFRVDPERLPSRPGQIYLELSQELQNRLDGQGDHHVAVVHLLDHADWRQWTDD